MGAIVLHDVTLGYERRPAVHHLDGTFAAGRLHAVVGPNGSGKSTLLKGVAGLAPPLSGRIELCGARPCDVAYLPQDPGVDRSFPITLGELVALGLWSRKGFFGAVGRADRHKVEHALEAVGLGGFARRAVDQVSGGQLQRALFARVLVQDARIVLLDEPFTALDARTTDDLMALIRRWPDEGRTVLLVLHDLQMVRELCAETLLLAREKVAWGPTAQVLTPETLATARRLSEAWSDDAHPCRKDAAA